MPSFRTEGVVLRTHKLGEADRIITMLTKDRGKVRAVAKGVRRTRSKFGARLEPFSHVDLLLHEGRSLDVVTQAESIDAFGQYLALDYGRWTAGQTMLETVDRLTGDQSPDVGEHYVLLVAALRTLTQGSHHPALVLDAYLLRSLSLSGYEPTLDSCVVCGEVGSQPFFHVPSGGTVCAQHRPPGSVAPRAEALAVMVALLAGDWQVADDSDASTRRDVAGMVAAYAQWHLERDLRSLPLVDRVP
jgi:DNA repair protein RecO (recombination protein O)